MKKFFARFIIFALVFSVVVPAGAIKAQAAEKDFNTGRYGDVLDIGTKLRHFESSQEYRDNLDKKIKETAKDINLNDEASGDDSSNNGSFTFDGGTKYFLGYDNGRYYLKTYTLRSVGENVEIWVANDLSFQDDRPTYVITQEQVDRMRDIFDETVYPTDTEFFGTPDSHTGTNAVLPGMVGLPQDYYAPSDGVERVMLLVDNIRDEQYYDPSYPFFIAGFYSGSVERYTDRNIINLDAKDWNIRLDSTFKGTAAHEFQHLIHDDNDPAEETYINEGMSDFADYLCFGEHPWGHINFFLDHPENSLTEWDDHYSAETGPETLADYGQAYLLQLYLYDQYGKDFVRDLATDGEDQGFAGLNKVLDKYNTGIDFKELFRRFSIAVAIDSPQPDNGIYNFKSIDLGVNYESALDYDKDGVPAWGGDYKEIRHADKIQNITIDGIDFLPTPWKVVEDPLGSGEKVLWGNNGNEKANQMIFKADLTNIDAATLTFDNYFDIEEQWDFGVVQVSIDDGKTWTSLANENTRDDVVDEGYPAIKNNLPGFTGSNGAWTNEAFDLTPYVGQEVLINFNYMTDWGSNGEGWFIDNIKIPEIDYSNDCSSTDDFMSINEINKDYVEYALVFINEKSLGVGKNIPNYRVLNIDPMNVTEADAIALKDFFSGGNNYMIVWYASPEKVKGTVDFTYEITTKSDFNKNKSISQ